MVVVMVVAPRDSQRPSLHHTRAKHTLALLSLYVSGPGSRIERLLFSDVDILMAKHHTPFTNPIDCSQKSTIVQVVSPKRKNDLPLISLQILPKTVLNPVLKLPLATKGNHLSNKAYNTS